MALYSIFDKTWLQLFFSFFFLSQVVVVFFFFSFFLSGFSDSMCAFLLCYWLCCKQSSKQNWFMIHFAAIQTASSEVTKKFCFCTHLINEMQRKTRQNRTPTWSDGMPNIKRSSQNPRCSSFSYHMSIICLFFYPLSLPKVRNLSFKEQKEQKKSMYLATDQCAEMDSQFGNWNIKTIRS